MRSRGGVAGAVAALVAVLSVATVGWAPGASAAVRPCSRGLVALTFDDGPSTRVTGALLDVLVARQVPATFFVVGERVAASPGLVRRAHRLGFVVGNHSYRHEQLTRLSDAGVRGTLRATERALRRVGVPTSGLMRPPYGSLDGRVRSVVAGLGLTPVLWDVDTRDWADGTAATITRRVLDGIRPGGRNIVLLHDGVSRSPTTLAAVPGIIAGARARGYCFAALGASGDPVAPVPGAQVSDAVTTEVGPGGSSTLRFRVRLDRPTTRPTSVQVRTRSRTAAPGEDYVAIDGLRVSFAAGSTSRTVSVRVRGDRTDEPRERLTVVLSDPRGLRLRDATGVGTIRDDDPPPAVSLDDATAVEPATGSAVATVRLRLDRPSSRPVVVTVATVSLEADESDYVPFEREVRLAPGARSAEVPLEVLADDLEEPVETLEVHVVSVRRGGVADGIARVRIEPPPPS